MKRRVVVSNPFLMGVKSKTGISTYKFRYSYVNKKKHKGIKRDQKHHNLYPSENISRLKP
jgi:hypothetical protein